MSQEREKHFLTALEQQFTQHYSERLSASNNAAQESARCLAELAAKVRIMEEVLLKEQDQNSDGNVALLNEALAVEAVNFYPHENFYEVEHHGDLAFRWTGEDPRIDFPLLIARNEAKEVTISIVAVAKPEFIQSLAVFADGNPLKVIAKEVNGYINLVATLPPLAQKKDATLLSILLPETVRPSDVADSADTRRLGLAIQKVSVAKKARNLLRFGK